MYQTIRDLYIRVGSENYTNKKVVDGLEGKYYHYGMSKQYSCIKKLLKLVTDKIENRFPINPTRLLFNQ